MHKVTKNSEKTGVLSSSSFRQCSASNCSSAASLPKSTPRPIFTSPGRKRTRPIKKKAKAKAQSSTSRLLAGLKDKKTESDKPATERCLRSVGNSLLQSPQRVSLDPARRQRSWDIVPTPQIYPHQTSIPIAAPVDYYGLSERKTLEYLQISVKSTEETTLASPSDVRGELERLQ